MSKAAALTKVLAVLGTNLVWLPLWTTVLFSLFFFLAEHQLRVDYLIPAELFAFALLGGALLIWAAMRARSRTRLIAWTSGLALTLFAAGQVVAMVTGLASGETEPGGWQQAIVLGSLAGYTLALAATGVAGILLLRDLFRRPRP